ncbi:hypothetical protein LOZ58_003268 [Ophidiomyces ophidiicola]|nr:hypothetical protein LOZ66_002075 [Ophidiomyces ophidiicola]KAI1961414.1 hypothetical protein LOZ58_003268 [Ophidiomyces ophidiicola]
MAGNKRTWEGKVVPPSQENTDMATLEQQTPIISLFSYFRTELEQHHDRRERVIKASRDITALSKKIIFALHRLRNLGGTIPENIAKENTERFAQIDALFKSLVLDLSGINAWRYEYQLTWGIQEYIEALSFQYYAENQRLISLDVVRGSLPPEILVTETDYVLGLFDLTGELMRFAITNIGKGGPRSQTTLAGANVDGSGESAQSNFVSESAAEGIMVDLRELRAMFEKLNVPRGHSLNKELAKKMEVMQASVEKVEQAAYGFLIRGRERPQGWIPDVSSAAPIASY